MTGLPWKSLSPAFNSLGRYLEETHCITWQFSFILLRKHYPVSRGCTLVASTSSAQAFQFRHTLVNTCYFLVLTVAILIDRGRPLWLFMHFPMISDVEHLLCLHGDLYVLAGEMPI